MLLKNYVHYLLLAMTATLFVACNSNDERLTENSKKESEIVSQSQIQAENENLQTQANKLEGDLKNRLKFYNAIKGMYFGDLKIGGVDYKIRMIFSQNLTVPDFTPFRSSRRVEEIQNDLNHLGLNIQVYQWKADQPMAGEACRLDNIKPELKKGQIIINTASCANYYELELSDELAIHAEAEDISSDIFAGNLEQVSLIKGIIAPSTNSEITNFTLKAKRE